jgi:hypothetical protein
MAEHSHAEHRPPPPGDEAGFEQPTSFGVLYPEHDVVAVIDDWQAAQQAVAALKALGMPAEDIDLLDNARARALNREAMQHQGLGDKLKRALSHVFSDDAAYQESLTDAVNAGAAMVIAHITDEAMVPAVGDVLLTYHARAGRYYGTGRVEDLV